MPAGLRICLLGGFRVELSGQPVASQAWQRTSARAVVKLLALAPGHRLLREQLTEDLWPDHEPAQAAVNLRKAVHFARHALSTDCIIADAAALQLAGAPLWVDVDAFEGFARSNQVEEALRSYAGDLLPEDLFEAWTEPRREQLSLRFTRLLFDWADDLRAAGRDRECAAALEQLIARDPLNEEAYVQLMTLHDLAGHRVLALKWFERLEAVLRRELGLAPGVAARGLRDSIAAGQGSAGAPKARHAPAAVGLSSSGLPSSGSVSMPEEEHKLSTVLYVALARNAVDIGVVQRIVRAWGATIIGDADESGIGVFGTPHAIEDHAARALRCALELTAALGREVRCGVATTEVTVRIGGPLAGGHVVGAALQLSGQLAEVASAGTVMVHDRTCRCSASLFEFAAVRRLRPITGRAPVPARQLLAERAAPLRQRGAPPMVGRESELAAVLSLADDVIDGGRPRLLLVHGAAGIGKSRLVEEAVTSIARRNPWARVLRARCRSNGRAATYWPLAEWVRQASGIRLGDAAGSAGERFQLALQELLQPLRLRPRELEATIDALAITAGVALPGSRLAQAQPNEIADELSRAWPRFATACASLGAAVLIVEDLHWADEPLVQMLERMGRRSVGPLLLLCTARSEFVTAHPGFGTAGEQSSTIAVRPLTAAASAQLVEGLPRPTLVAAARLTDIVAMAEGNPFFLEQLSAHVAEGAAGLLPDSVQSVLAARIDALPDLEKRVLQQAAVVGRVFWQDAVSRALGDVDADPPLQALERRGLVQTRTVSSLSGQVELAFTHALVRDVAYRSLSERRKSVAHAVVGSWLEERTEGTPDEVAELVAEQFATAVELGAEFETDSANAAIRLKAFDFLLLAGVVARRQGTAIRAIELHRRALDHATTDRARVAALEELGADNESVFHGDQARDSYLRALELARPQAGSAEVRSRLCRKVAGLMAMTPGAFRTNPDPREVEALVGEGLASATDDISRAWLLIADGACARLWQGSEPFGQGAEPDPVDIDVRIAAVAEALEVGEAHDLPDLVFAANDALVVLFGIAGRYRDVVARARSQLGSIDRLPSRLGQADVVRKVAVLAIEIEGRLAEGRELAETACALSRDTNAHQLMHATYPLLVALHHLGRWRELLDALQEHVDAFGEEPATGCQFVRDGPILGAVTLVHLGDRARAEKMMSLVPDPAAQPGSASAWQSRLAVLLGNPALALEISADKVLEGRTYGPQHAVAVLEALTALEDWPALSAFLPTAQQAIRGNALLLPWCERAAALVAAAGGRRREAGAGLARAAADFADFGVELETARTREQLAQFRPAAQRDRLLREAIGAYDRLGATRYADAARDRLGSMRFA